MTNADKIRAMSLEDMVKVVDCPKYITGEDIKCIPNCWDCRRWWLSEVIGESKVEPKEEPHKPKVPSLIDRPNFERQLESFSIKAFVQQFKYLACKINEIIKYLEETVNENR